MKLIYAIQGPSHIEPDRELSKAERKADSTGTGLSAAQRALRAVDSRLELQMPVLRTATAVAQPPPTQSRYGHPERPSAKFTELMGMQIKIQALMTTSQRFEYVECLILKSEDRFFEGQQHTCITKTMKQQRLTSSISSLEGFRLHICGWLLQAPDSYVPCEGG